MENSPTIARKSVLLFDVLRCLERWVLAALPVNRVDLLPVSSASGSKANRFVPAARPTAKVSETPVKWRLLLAFPDLV